MNIFIMRDTNELLRMTNLPGKAKETQTKLTSKVASCKVFLIKSFPGLFFMKPWFGLVWEFSEFMIFL